MTHSVALTEFAIELMDGPNMAKAMARWIVCSHRTIQAWKAKRRAMCLDHAIKLAARNLAFHERLNAEIELLRRQNAIQRGVAAAAAGGLAAAGGTTAQTERPRSWECRTTADEDTARLWLERRAGMRS